MPLAGFLASDALEAAIDRIVSDHGGADRRAAASFWSLYYVSALSIPYVVARRAGLSPDLNPERMTILVAGNGLPETFGLLAPVSQAEPADDPLTIVTPLIRGHLEPLAALLKTRTGIAPKLCFNNAAVYLDYALSATGMEGAWPAEPLFVREWLGDGSRNPFHGLLKQEAVGDQIHCRRKVCCLRYQLPGIHGCGELCALPELRKAS